MGCTDHPEDPAAVAIATHSTSGTPATNAQAAVRTVTAAAPSPRPPPPRNPTTIVRRRPPTRWTAPPASPSLRATPASSTTTSTEDRTIRQGHLSAGRDSTDRRRLVHGPQTAKRSVTILHRSDRDAVGVYGRRSHAAPADTQRTRRQHRRSEPWPAACLFRSPCYWAGLAAAGGNWPRFSRPCERQADDPDARRSEVVAHQGQGAAGGSTTVARGVGARLSGAAGAAISYGVPPPANAGSRAQVEDTPATK